MKILAKDNNGIMSCFLPFFERTTNLIEAEKVVVWQDVKTPCKKIVELAKEMNKETIVIEHGMGAVRDYYFNLWNCKYDRKPHQLIADKICVWGSKSKQMLVESGVSEERIRVVGSSILWDYEYRYTHKDRESIIKYYVGKETIDPETHETWTYAGWKAEIPHNIKRDLVIFFPHHDNTELPVEANKMTWNQIRERTDLFTKLSEPYIHSDENNPFNDLIFLKEEERNKRCVVCNVRTARNMEINKRLLERAKCIVSASPGTINGCAWAMDVPVIQPRIDWFDRTRDGDIVYNIREGDYECEPDKINEKIDEVLKEDTKKEARRKAAIEWMGIEEGNPRDNIIRVIKE